MRVTMLAGGTRGDVQPLVVLGAELRRRGHNVTMGFPPNLVGFGHRVGFEVHAVGPDSQDFLESPEGQGWLASGNVKAFMNALTKVFHDNAVSLDAETVRACEGADVVVAGILAEDRAVSIAEAHRVPVVLMHNAPFRPTRAYPNYLFTSNSLPAAFNVATGTLANRMWWRGIRDDINGLRKELGLAPTKLSTAKRVASVGGLELQAYSNTLTPELTDYGSNRPFIGFLTPGAEERRQLGETGIDPDLETWLAEGEPPAYIGFGSMPVIDPQEIVAMVGRVTGRLGLRALVSAGWSQIRPIEDAGARMRVVGALNHDAVLPRCRLAVHHGGAGTTAASIGAGLATMICSVFADQPFWGTRVTELGAGAHVRFAALTERSFEDGMRKALDPETSRRAIDLGLAIRAETDAATRAADIVESTT